MVAVDGTTQPDKGILQEVASGDEWIDDACVGKFALVDGNVSGIYLSGAVPLFVDIDIVVYASVEIVAKNKGKTTFDVARGSDNKVAGGCRGHDVAGTLVIEAGTKHGDLVVANKGVEF